MKRLVLALALAVSAVPLFAQPVMIPTLQVCNVGKAFGTAQVQLSRRVDVNSTSLDSPADVVSVLVVDRNGNRLAYGTGPIKTGEITVQQF